MWSSLMDSMGLSESNFVQADLDKAKAALEQSPALAGLTELKSNIGGEVLLPSDSDQTAYNAIRSKNYNKGCRGYPLAIIKVKSTDDVSKVVEFHKKFASGIPLCVASGQNSPFAMKDGAIAIDMTGLDNIAVDEATLTVSVGGGATQEKIDAVLAPYDMAVIGCCRPEVSLAGFALNGGHSYFSRLYGTGADNIIEAEIVLASGTVINANDNNEHADILFGLRGGGGNFGIVTKLTVKAYKVPATVMGGMVVYVAPTTASKKATIIEFDKVAQEAGEETCIILTLTAGPPVVPVVITHLGGQSSVEEVPFLVKATNLGGWFRATVDVKPTSYHNNLQKLLTSVQLPGYHHTVELYAGSINEPLLESLIDTLTEYAGQSLPAQLEKAIINISYLGGKNQTADDGTKTCVPAGARNARYFIIVNATAKAGTEAEGVAAAVKWTQDVYAILRPFQTCLCRVSSSGSFPEDGIDAALLAKLRALKGKYDPSNLFNQNHNITPA